MRSLFPFSRLVVRTVCIFLCVMWLWCGVSVEGYAQIPMNIEWEQTNGLEGGVITCFAASGTTLFAGASYGAVFRSTDNGTSWSVINTGLPVVWRNSGVTALMMNGSTLFVGTNSNGIFRSINNGTTWTSVNTGLTNTLVYSLTMNGSALFAATGSGIFRSTDNGSSWTYVNTLITAVSSLIVSDSSIFAGTSNSGIFRSTDNGGSWTAVNTGLSSILSVHSLTVSGSNIFAVTKNTGRVFRSTDNGVSWAAINDAEFSASFVTSLIVNSGNIFAGTLRRGVFRSIDNSGSWATVNTGLTNTDVRSLIVSGSTLFAGTSSGIFRTTIPSPLPLLIPSHPFIILGTTQTETPSTPKTYTLTGQNLTTSTITITAPTGVEIATAPNGQFSTTLALPVINGSLSATSIFVRLNSANARTVSGDTITHRAGSTSAYVQVFGVVQRPPAQLTTTPQPITFNTIVHFDPSPQQTYIVTGANLIAPVVVTAPDGILLFNTATSTWTRSLTLATSATGSLMQTVAVRLDSSQLRNIVNQEIIHQSTGTQATVRVSGAVIPLLLPVGAETTLELRLVAQRSPLLIRDTARVQLWLKDSRLLTPRLIGRFVKKLRATVQIDTNNLAILDVVAGSGTRASLEGAVPPVPRTPSPLELSVVRIDTLTTSNMLLAEIIVMATLGETTNNTIRLAQPTEWRASNGNLSNARVAWLPDSLRIEIAPLIKPRPRSAFTAIVAPNPSNGAVQLHYTLSTSASNDEPLTLIVSDMAGSVVHRTELGLRKGNTPHQERVRLTGLAAGPYRVLLVSPSEVFVGRLDIVK